MAVGDFPLKGKIVVVTGGGSGICLAFVQKAVQAGAKVLIADLKLTAQAQSWFETASKSAPVRFEKCDVAKWDDLKNLVAASKKYWGDVPDVYVAGAGVFEPAWSNFWDDAEQDRYRELDINASHPIKLTRIALEAFARANKKGVALSVASLAGVSGTYSAPLYCASKHAVVGFTRSMALADKYEGVKIATICPGLVSTPLWTDEPDKMNQFMYSEERACTPDAVATAMMDVITQAKHPGGTVLEVIMEGTRVLPEWEIKAPAGVGVKVPEAVLEHNIAPVRKIMNGIRGKSKL